MTDYARVNIILGLVLFLEIYLVLHDGGNSYIAFSLILISTLLIALLFHNLSLKFKNPISSLKNSLFLPLIALSIVLVFATVFSISPSTSFPKLCYLLGVFLIFFVISQISFEDKHFKYIFYFIFGLTLLECLIAIYFFLTSGLSGSFLRMTGTFYWPNPFAGFLLFGLPISLFLFWSSQGKARFWFLFSCSIILSVFVLTYSKGAFLSFILPFSLLVYHFRSTLKKEFLLKIISLILLTALLTSGIINLKKFTSGKSTYAFINQQLKAQEIGVVTSLTRFAYMKGAWKIFLDHKAIGTGLETFAKVYPQYQKSPVEYSKFPHNFYLELLSETGIFGFLGFLSFVLWLLFLCLKLFKIQNKIFLPLFAGILGSLLHIGVDFDFFYPSIFLLFFVFSGLLYGIYLRMVLKLKEETYQFKYASLAAFCLSVFLFVFGLLWFFSNYNFAIARALEKKGEIDQAKIYYQKSLNLLNKNPQVYYDLARIEFEKENLKEAEKSVQEAIKRDPYFSLNYELLGRIYLKMNNKEKAEESFKKAIAKDPINRPWFYVDLAQLYLDSNQKEKAKETASSILAVYPPRVVETLYLNKNLPYVISLLKEILEEAQK